MKSPSRIPFAAVNDDCGGEEWEEWEEEEDEEVEETALARAARRQCSTSGACRAPVT